MAEQASHPTNGGTVTRRDFDNLQDTSTLTMHASLPSVGGGDPVDSEDLLMFFEDEDQHIQAGNATQLPEPTAIHETTNDHGSDLHEMSARVEDLALVQEHIPRQDTGMIKVLSESLTCKADNPSQPQTPR